MKSSRRQFLILSALAVGIGFATRAFAKKKTKVQWDGIVANCVVTCPTCKTQVQEYMVSESLRHIWHCPVCLTWLSPKKGDHCIYDSYGSVNCPQIQVKKKREKGETISDAGEA